jgi:hypothetical protein
MNLTRSTKVELTNEEWAILDHAIEGMCAANRHDYELDQGVTVMSAADGVSDIFGRAFNVALTHIFPEDHAQLRARFNYSVCCTMPMTKSEFETWAADVIHQRPELLLSILDDEIIAT